MTRHLYIITRNCDETHSASATAPLLLDVCVIAKGNGLVVHTRQRDSGLFVRGQNGNWDSSQTRPLGSIFLPVREFGLMPTIVRSLAVF